MSILDRIDATLDNLCPCGATPRPGSPYCGPDCEPTHLAADTDTNGPGRISRHGVATPMRWRPDLVTAADDAYLIAIGSESLGYTGPHRAQIYERASDPTVWHLRLDDGHRFVGCDLTNMGGQQDPITVEQTARIHGAWQRLERELGNTRHLEPDDQPYRFRPATEAMDRAVANLLGNHLDTDDPWADVMGYPTRWRYLSAHTILRYCMRCNRHVTTRDGMRLTVDRRPAAYLATAADIREHATNLEPCQLCANCRALFPGPTVYVTLERDHWTPTIRIRMKADGYERVETHLNVEDVALGQLTAAIQQAADQLEARLFSTPASRPQPSADAATLRLLNAPIWTIDPQHIFRNLNAT